mgnify:CR=1 FL=1|tara:strand:+ start:17706 stop:18635 length:930 start_codon:yes stop_codon:yes gene_type:complete
MWGSNQNTLKNKVNFSGIGLHSGKKVSIELEPSHSNTGIIFKRNDLKENNEIVANFKNVTSVKLCTKIENEFGTSVSTVEHLMAAFYICGIDNLIVNINGPEVPIMDGSAKEFVEKITECGLKELNAKRKFIKIIKKTEIKLNDKSISISPTSNTFKVSFTLRYDSNPLIQSQSNQIDFRNKNLENIYSARTFCLYEDIEKVKSFGLGKGGSLENAVVVKENKVLNVGGLRSENEFVNHKILDLAGDFMLAGMRIVGSVECSHGGHALTNDFLRKVLSHKSNFNIVDNPENVTNIQKIRSEQKRIAVNA